MKSPKRTARAEPCDPAQITFRTVRHTSERIRRVAKKEGFTVNSLIAAAIYIHLHRVESRGDPKLRRTLVCEHCGKPVDADVDGTRRAKRAGKRQTKTNVPPP